MTIFDSQETLSLLLLGAGMVFLAASTVGAALWRRGDKSVGALLWAGSAAAIHPGKFVRPERVGAIRMLNTVGVTLFLLGVVVLVVP